MFSDAMPLRLFSPYACCFFARTRRSHFMMLMMLLFAASAAFRRRRFSIRRYFRFRYFALPPMIFEAAFISPLFHASLSMLRWRRFSPPLIAITLPPAAADCHYLPPRFLRLFHAVTLSMRATLPPRLDTPFRHAALVAAAMQIAAMLR